MVGELHLEKSRVEALIGEGVSDFSVSAGCKDGDGMAGSLKSITATTMSGKKHHLVLKDIDLDSPLGGERSIENGAFRVENLVYSTLIPMLTGFAKSRGVDAQIPVPRIYDCYKGEIPLDNYICMEDVRFQGYKMTDKYAGLTLEETLLVMKEIGRYHALSYALVKWEGEKLFAGPLSPLVEYFMMTRSNDEVKNQRFLGFAAVMQSVVKNGIELIEKRNPALHQKMKAHFEKTVGPEIYPELQFGIVNGTDSKYFPIITHGDLWSNNIMFKYNADGMPVSLKFLDFQFSRRGNIYEELTYFLYTSTTPQFRRTHPLSPLQSYYDAFTGRLKELKVAEPIGFTLGTFLDSFKENIPHVFRYMHFAIPLQLGTSIPEVAAMMQGGQSGQNGNGPPAPQPQMSREQEMQIFITMMKIQMETKKSAMDRYEELVQEMVELNII